MSREVRYIDANDGTTLKVEPSTLADGEVRFIVSDGDYTIMFDMDLDDIEAFIEDVRAAEQRAAS